MNVLKGLLALAVVFLFAQCTDNKGTSTEASAPAVAGTNMKIAYVEVDSLLTKYRYWNDLNELMIQKEENIRTTLNEKAKELGMKHTQFKNCTGLDDDIKSGHFSSAYDVGLMSRELIMKHPGISKYSTVWMDTIIHITKKGESVWFNKYEQTCTFL